MKNYLKGNDLVGYLEVINSIYNIIYFFRCVDISNFSKFNKIKSLLRIIINLKTFFF